jgi:peptidoglycan hydrolase-like protein with peptidoglycan-binding domain
MKAASSPASSSRFDQQIKDIQIALNQLNAASPFIEESVGSIKFYKKDKKDKSKALEEDGLWGPQTQMAIRLFSLPRNIDYDPKNKGAFLASVKKEIPKAQPSASLPSTGITSADIPVYSSSAGLPSRVPLPKP